MKHQFSKYFFGLFLLIIALQAMSAIPPYVNGKKVPSLAPMLEKIVPAVVNIATQSKRAKNPYFNHPAYRYPGGQRSKSLGSGVIIDAKKGLILTNSHVIAKASKITVILHDKRTYTAKVIGHDKGSDVAVIQIDAKNLTQIPIGNSDKLRVGDFVVAIGNPFGLGHSVTSGIVSALHRSGLSIVKYENLIQTDASINPGNSGGPLVNLKGELIGVNTAIISKTGRNTGIGFAIPANMARKLMVQLVNYGEVRRGLLGVHIQDLNAKLARALGVKVRHGAIIARVVPGSSAQKAGLNQGDIIIKVNGKKINSASALQNKIGLMDVGQKVKLTVLRDGQRHHVDATLSTQPKKIRTASLTQPQTGAPSSSFHKHLLGASFANITKRRLFSGGILISSVDTLSPAWNSGLRPGDIIVAVNKQPTKNLKQFKTALNSSVNSLLLYVKRKNTTLYIYLE